MGFSRYAIEKKQVSTDRGVTWQDVTPSETQRGNLIGTYRTLLECEDAACELEKYEYRIVEGELPYEICGEFYVPEGIIKTFSFISGALCCQYWYDSSVVYYDYIEHKTVSSGTGKRQCSGSYCPGWNYGKNLNNNGMSLQGVCNNFSCYGEEYSLCPCYTIDEVMPWAEGKTNWKLIEKQHYTRPHCSDEWEADGEPEIIGIAERWRFVTDNFYTETWQHQEAKSFDENGNVAEWEDKGNPTITYFNSTLPDGLEIIDELRSDGTMLTANSNLMSQIGRMQFRRGNYTTSISGVALSSVYSYGSTEEHNTFNSSTVTSTTFSYYRRPTSYPSQSFCGIFFDPIIDDYHCNTNPVTGKYMYCDYISGARNVLDGICTGLIRTSDGNSAFSAQDKLGTLFPYRIPAPTMDMEDEYYNGSEYGYVRRDGTVYPIGYITGKYTDSNGNTKHIAISTEIDGSWDKTWHYNTPIPSNVVSISSIMTNIPYNYLNGRTSLSSVTLSDTVSIGSSAFKGTTGLHTITFPSSLRTIGEEAFMSGGLSAVSFNNVETVGNGAFRDCQQLVNVDFGSALSGISQYCFYGDGGLTSVVIPGTVKSIGNYSFSGCTSLSSVTLNEGILSVGYNTFSNTNINSIEIPSTLTSYGYTGAFKDCSNLEYVTINSTAAIGMETFVGCNIKELTMNITTPPGLGSEIDRSVFTFAQDGIILVPASAVDTFKTHTGTAYYGGWSEFANRIYPIPNETVWVNIGYACVDGQRYDYECKMGRNTEYSNDWFFLPEYRTVGEPYGECDGTEPY